MTVEYHPAVEQELRDIRDFYESGSPLLGMQFIDEFDKLVQRMALSPGRWMVLQGEVRRALMRRFPYVVYFRQVSPQRIRVLVVKHQRRHPAFGRGRR